MTVFRDQPKIVDSDNPAAQLAVEVMQHVSSTAEYDGEVLRKALYKLGYEQENVDDNKQTTRDTSVSGLDDSEDRQSKPAKSKSKCRFRNSKRSKELSAIMS